MNASEEWPLPEETPENPLQEDLEEFLKSVEGADE